jgi:hypothetical protein
VALRRLPGFVGPSYTSFSKIAAFDRSVNLYAEKNESGTGVAPYWLYPTPGYQTFAVMPTSPGRALFTLNGGIFAIGGSALYEVPPVQGGIPILRAQGLSNPDNGVAQILSNGDGGHQLLIRSGSTLYVLDLLAPISEATFLDPPSTELVASPVVGANLTVGYYGYVVTFGTATGETTAGPRLIAQNPGAGNPGGGAFNLTDIPLGPGAAPALTTARGLYRTAVQTTIELATSAQLKLLTTLNNNTTGVFADTIADASLGANVPTINTAAITIEALTEIDVPATQIAYLNGYGLALDANTSKVRFSPIFNFAPPWDEIDVFQRSDAADKWQAMLVHHKEVWLFGLETSSVYYNGEDPDIPFQPIPSVFIPYGIAAPLSACVVDGAPMWIGQGKDGTGVVYRANGYTPVRVSTHAVEWAFRSVPSLAYAEGSTYQENGHVFYELTFPSSGETTGCTWVYDATADLWHERGDWDGLQFIEEDSRDHRQVGGVQLTLSRTSGVIYTRSVLYATGPDGVTGLVRLRRMPHLNQAQARIRYSHFRLLMETGLGLVTGQGDDPSITLSWSDDGGQTFGASYTVSAGPIGAYATLVDWWQLGQGRDRIFQVVVSDPISWRWVDCFIDESVGPS